MYVCVSSLSANSVWASFPGKLMVTLSLLQKSQNTNEAKSFQKRTWFTAKTDNFSVFSA